MEATSTIFGNMTIALLLMVKVDEKLEDHQSLRFDLREP